MDAHGDGVVTAGEGGARKRAAGAGARRGLVTATRVTDGRSEETRAQEVAASCLP